MPFTFVLLFTTFRSKQTKTIILAWNLCLRTIYGVCTDINQKCSKTNGFSMEDVVFLFFLFDPRSPRAIFFNVRLERRTKFRCHCFVDFCVVVATFEFYYENITRHTISRKHIHLGALFSFHILNLNFFCNSFMCFERIYARKF